MNIEIDIEKGDIVTFNDVSWVIEERKERSDDKEIILHPLGTVSKTLTLTIEELEERIEFSGDFRRVKSSYTDVLWNP